MPLIILFHRLLLRPLRREPVRTTLTVLAVALGIGVVLAIELAGEAAAGSFRSSVETLAGDADFEITATGGVPAEVYANLALLPEPLQIRARLEDYAVIAGRDRTVPFLGIDLLAGALPDTKADTSHFNAEDSIWTGADLGLRPGDTLRLQLNDKLATCTVRGILGPRSGEVIVMDLAPASRLLGRTQTLDRILIQTPSTRTIEAWEQLLQRALPSTVKLARHGTQTTENRRMLAAFRWNLRVLSYIALIVGAFLIYNTISVSVVRRRPEIGVLRALGATRSAILLGFLAEAACIGLLGALAGLVLGLAMARGAVGMVSATVESLYVSSRPASIELTADLALIALAAGIGVAILSALSPAWEASQVTPIDAMSRGRTDHRARLHQSRHLLLAALLAAAAWLVSRQPAVGGKPLFGYLAALLLIGASALAIPTLVTLLARTTGTLLGVQTLLASRSLAGSLRRTSVLVGALSTAIAILVAVGIMVGSFRQTVLLWMDDRLQADLYVRPAGSSGADRHPTLSPDLPDRLRALPIVSAIDTFRAYDISYQGMPAILGAGDAHIDGRYGRRPFLSGADPRAVFEKLTEGDNAIVSEAFANKHHVRAGDALTLPLGGRTARLRVLDIYYDYSNERGYIILHRDTLLKYLPDPAPSNLAVYLKPGVSLEESRRTVEQALAGSRVLIFSNRTLREEAIRIFDRTFAITYALECVAVFVAVMGVAGALLALVIDRRREFGLLRFLGAAQSQIRGMILCEAALLGLLANVAGLILGLLLSLLLIYVINRQSFGWTIQFHWPVAVLLGALSIVYAATLLAGLHPARIATRLNPIEVVHED